ncbi:MAG: replication-associated recombination protein A [Firmicutes bacterium]|nr:replication-associated recombination protein A [Bacillota bacterium]HOB35750.1 replication-associated recombination protein A [Bacillota bacterium]HPZ90795.1 replication-associated recombination protein A [Bacillota bacterium]HQE01749.1 replication-associated recombination protein A [Bacillota bacterium]
MSDLFSYGYQQQVADNVPLAARMRPRTLDEFVGQKHIVGPGSLLRRAISADRLTSMIFYGPPGTGKTTLAAIIANQTRASFQKLNAVTAGVAQVREVAEEARRRLEMYRQATVLFIDEIHRFNKGQQDALLPAVEDGTVLLIGATTENPFFSINSALLSRCRLFELYPLTREEVSSILDTALKDGERGLGRLKIDLLPAAREHILATADGDARVALNALELAALTTPPNAEGVIVIDEQAAEQSVQRRVVRYDRDGDNHYDVISAFIKSIRGSDPDAAVFWLAKMLDAGEDPRFVARRLYIAASEDVGNADPMALLVAQAAFNAVEVLGMPEARIVLAQAVTYLACAPKSNAAYVALEQAVADARRTDDTGVPNHLRDSHYPGARQLGRGKGYQYPHDFPGNYVAQQYLPDSLAHKRYYRPGTNGYERRLRRWLEKTKGLP